MAFKFLAHADAEVTTENLDSEKIKSHKIETEKPTDEELKLPEYKKLETELREAYLQSMEEVVFLEKEKYQEEKTYSELGVFTKKAFKKAQIIPGLKGMTAFSPNTITIDTFSVLDKGRKNLERVMLGPASFINHACKPNADWVVQGEWSKTTLVVKTIRHIKKGEEITLSYGNLKGFGQFCQISFSYDPWKWRFRVMPNYSPNNPSAGGIWYVLKYNCGVIWHCVI